MRKSKKGIFLCVIASVFMMAVPVCAETRYDLDVSDGDRYSYYAYKDTGAQYENVYYVTPTTYVGNIIMGNSVSNTGYSSGWTKMNRYGASYSYGVRQAPGGIYYRLMAGPGVNTGSDWHLVGRYTP